MDYFRSLKYTDFKDKVKPVKTYSLSKLETKQSRWDGYTDIIIPKYYSKRDHPTQELETPVENYLLEFIKSSKHTYLLHAFHDTLYRKNKNGEYEYLSVDGSWKINDDMDDEYLAYCLPYECMFKIKA